MRAWLYPVSGSRRFRDARGRTRPTTPDAIGAAVGSGAFPAEAAWPCVQNGANVAAGDALFLYAGDTGIFAAGRVRGAEPSGRRTRGGAPTWTLRFSLDAARTRRLMDAPVPPEEVRAHVHPRVTVRDFTEGARALRRTLR